MSAHSNMGTLHRGTHFVLQPFLASGYLRLVRMLAPLGGVDGAGDKMHAQRMMLAPAPHPAKVFATIAAAVGWLLPYVQALSTSAVSEADLLRAVDANLTAFRDRAR